ncbi:bifunctional 4-hydroxy-2-oxoglutarate aldolase/2-dehydro-3-deoxy-phosphogluconate aldolase [Paenibacillus hexagrammi]|uniref:Bifunctional 4-hydroxy-2-oxoglutarate aldolase/2-dehydro-3-deoxy-phosphogluconate aldolase n=1 Tax=Paenibacillus hexagrammi TaxID=2908839 RepID=A0ABY3SG74_9BACL|nr:bifunctional 4-hydroxy-2-oxoglutarate aldolase/2-dehydro-3-deoxy-phosphogluconate aldolase [Paenibacillus sp. YPD9-1]UJF32921.1 bifunctional 4-hydroxy-2-oxoglutarate aldolase/2-dehydro-3-deoxy-phosphogluconate aldolase [Paenibacillus sp. YPD9-1]
MQEWLRQFKLSKVIAIVRGIEPGMARPLFAALAEGGIRYAEVTLNTPDALPIIHEMREAYGERMSIGAGTVLTVKQAEEAIQAGAEFLISPHVDADIIRLALSRDVPPLPGAMTPTEIVQAVHAGALAVKVFPCSSLGPGYIKELRGPLAHIEMIAVGGITKENAAAYMEAGAVGVGIGGSLISLPKMKEGRYNEITAYAKQLHESMQHL